MPVSKNSKAFGSAPSTLLTSVVTPSSVTGTLVQTVLGSFVVPAGTLTPGAILRISPLWSHGGTLANNRTHRVRFGGVEFQNHVVSSSASAQSVVALRCVSSNQVVGHNVSTSTGVGNLSGARTLGTIDVTVDQTIELTVTLAVAADSTTLEAFYVEVLT